MQWDVCVQRMCAVTCTILTLSAIASIGMKLRYNKALYKCKIHVHTQAYQKNIWWKFKISHFKESFWLENLLFIWTINFIHDFCHSLLPSLLQFTFGSQMTNRRWRSDDDPEAVCSHQSQTSSNVLTLNWMLDNFEINCALLEVYGEIIVVVVFLDC